MVMWLLWWWCCCGDVVVVVWLLWWCGCCGGVVMVRKYADNGMVVVMRRLCSFFDGVEKTMFQR